MSKRAHVRRRRTWQVMFAVLVALASITGNAQTVKPLDGKLVDSKTGAAVAGATVMIAGQSGSVPTDADGRFKWPVDVLPPFTLIVQLPGGRVARPILVEKADPSVLLSLKVEAAINEETTVAIGVAPSIETSPGMALTMLSSRDVALRSPSNLMAAIEAVPGINQVSEGQAAVPAIRGLARGRTLILIDGARVTSERRVGPSATFLDPAVVDGIDIARGPGTVAYGSDAFGGVVSVRTRRPTFNGLQLAASGTFGAGVPDRRGDVMVSKGFGAGGVLASVHARKAEDYRGPDADVFNSGWADRGALVRLSTQAGPGLFSASWQGDFGSDIERPRNNSTALRFYYPFENSHRVTLSYDATGLAGLETMALSGFLGAIEQRTDQDRFPTPTRARDIARSDMTAKDFQLRVTGQKLFGARRIEFGADINGRYGLEAHEVIVLFDLAGNQTSTSDALSVESARRVDTGFFFQGSTPIGGNASASGGARVDRVSNLNKGGFFGDRSVSHTAGSGFGAITVRPMSPLTLTLQVGRGFRDPTISDRFFRGPSGRGFITGNPDLEPETSRQVDFSARYDHGRIRVAGYLYDYRIADLVERFPTGEPDSFAFRNRGRAKIHGGELEVQTDLGRGAFLELGAQVGRGRALDDDTALDDISPNTVSLGIRQAIASKGTVFLRVAAYGKDTRPGPSEVEAPGHTNVDLGASWALTNRFEIRGIARNLLNREYFASPDPRFVLAPGRNAAITIGVRY